MTLNELSQLFWLNKEIEHDQRRLDELEQSLGFPSSSQLTGRPSAHDVNSSVERMAVMILELRALMTENREKRIRERDRIEKYIASIPDGLTREVFRLRFAEGLSWAQVAAGIGGKNSVDRVKKICYRHLKIKDIPERDYFLPRKKCRKRRKIKH